MSIQVRATYTRCHKSWRIENSGDGYDCCPNKELPRTVWSSGKKMMMMPRYTFSIVCECVFVFCGFVGTVLRFEIFYVISRVVFPFVRFLKIRKPFDSITGRQGSRSSSLQMIRSFSRTALQYHVRASSSSTTTACWRAPCSSKSRREDIFFLLQCSPGNGCSLPHPNAASRVM